MKGSHPRPADRCPFVLGHSISQVTSFMQLGMLWIQHVYKTIFVETNADVYNSCIKIKQILYMYVSRCVAGNSDWKFVPPLHRCHNGRNGVSNHQRLGCLLIRLFMCKSKKASKRRVTGHCAVTGEFPSQWASNAKNVSIWWRHHLP